MLFSQESCFLYVEGYRSHLEENYHGASVELKEAGQELCSQVLAAESGGGTRLSAHPGLLLPTRQRQEILRAHL